jgi:hypothetical protein
MAIAAALMGGLLLLSACDEASKTSSASPPASDADPTIAGSPEVSEPPPPDPTAIPLERYRYHATLTLTEKGRDREKVSVSTTGRYVSPDRHSIIYTITLADGTEVEQRLVAIGQRAWFKVNDSLWKRTNLQDKAVLDLLSNAFTPLRSEFLGGHGLMRVQDSVQDVYGVPESINGVAALHYKVDATGKALLDTFLPPEASSATQGVEWDLWLTEEGGWPIQIQASFDIDKRLDLLSGLRLRPPVTWKLVIEISGPNDPGMMIYPPVK